MSNLSGLTGTDGYSATAQYNWAGMRTSLTYGPFAYGPFTESRTYSNLLQLTRLTDFNSLAGTQMDMEYVYQSGQNNGRITQSIDHILNETVNYGPNSGTALTTSITSLHELICRSSAEGFTFGPRLRGRKHRPWPASDCLTNFSPAG